MLAQLVRFFAGKQVVVGLNFFQTFSSPLNSNESNKVGHSNLSYKLIDRNYEFINCG